MRSSSSAVQNRQAQYILVVNAIAEVIHIPAVPALTKPESANSVVMSTATAPRQSKFRSSQRFVIQKLYHIYVRQVFVG